MLHCLDFAKENGHDIFLARRVGIQPSGAGVYIRNSALKNAVNIFFNSEMIRKLIG